ncbi:MAG TPA: lysine 5,6-aminomutase subunit alpha, partial [Vitreimonas sp.]|nr:lysine 5,6-aminomutase subunit alpha [Vitreimonas sp.]
MTSELRDLDRLATLAATIAGAWGARARGSTTSGQERALLRLFGVHGLAADGRPLAGEVVDRYFGGNADRLAGGIALPFAMGLAEYDLAPQQLALD